MSKTLTVRRGHERRKVWKKRALCTKSGSKGEELEGQKRRESINRTKEKRET